MLRNVKSVFSFSKRFFQSNSNTIFALSTNIKNSGSAIAVIRVAGPDTSRVIDKLTNGKGARFHANPRKAIVQNLYDHNELIDRAMMLFFPGPNSYTGEDMCEFHLHGSQAIIAKMFHVLFHIDGCRPATEGEFTRRALINGKVGLIEAEAIGDLITAKTDLQRKRALSAFSGAIDSKLEHWRSRIISNMAHLEAFIDFGEDELIEDNVLADFVADISKLSSEIGEHLNNSARRSHLIKDGVQMAIVGEANVGKSSLMNCLCQKSLSIVSPISGTTRDIVQGHLDFAGYCLSIADTAGIKQLNSAQVDPIEREGIQRAIHQAQNSNILLVVLDSTTLLRQPLAAISEQVRDAIKDRNTEEMIFIINKIDLFNDKKEELLRLNETLRQLFDKDGQKYCLVSCSTGQGLNELTAVLETKVQQICGNPELDDCYSNDRHVMHLTKTKQLLDNIRVEGDLAIAASTLRQAAHQLACLTGNITTDDVLDVLFRDFCIGK